MKRTKQQLITQFKLLISQTDANTDLTDQQIAGYINEAIQFTAVLVEWPRDIVDTQAKLNIPLYTLPVDSMKIRHAYFGDVNINGDVYPLDIFTEEKLKIFNSNWLDKTTQSSGKPARCTLIDRRSVHLDPKPDADSSATGKKLLLSYVYFPSSLVNDGDIPDLPQIYHDFLKFYAAYLAYLGPLKNVELAEKLKNGFISDVKGLQPAATEETDEMWWTIGNYEGEINPEVRLANYRL